MAAIKAIIYDLDGVLIDSRAANAAFYNQILRNFGMPDITPEQLRQAQFLTSKEAVDLLFQGTPYQAAAQDYQSKVDNRPFLPLISLEPNVKETLARLRPAYGTAIATNRGRSLTLVLESLGLAAFFDVVVSSLDVVNPKPHPESLRLILRHFGINPQEAVYIGDAEADRSLAAGAGVPFLAYKNTDLEALYHLQDHTELHQILANWPQDR
ncbi:MAG: HAD-IA family hydrolase [Deltaproteobacteria bacterium]|nr:HAD-IA family hydrolase [Deltaproteobacteria bacterium]